MKGRTLANEMRPETIKPQQAVNLDPPEWLTLAGAHQWRYMVEQLSATGVLSTIDLGVLALFCNEYAVYLQAETALREEGRTVKLYTQVATVKAVDTNAWHKIKSKALDNLIKMSTEYGLTPASRTSIGVGGKPVYLNELPNSDDRKAKKVGSDLMRKVS